jgi:glycine/D-amino acid oxidase-like deaminating enzyme
MNSKRVAIIGGGIVGLATAYRLSERFPGARVWVLEKEAGVGRHQTGHNSGVLHCGLYYKPGSVKARLAVTGIRQMVEFCRENAVPHEICGKLVVAADESEVPRLRALEERGAANGLEGLCWLDRDRMREIEPHVGGVAALRVPQEGIVDYRASASGWSRSRARREGRDRRARRSPRPLGRGLVGRDHGRARSKSISSSIAPGCIPPAWPRSLASAATCASCPSAASTTRSAKSASTWCGT